VLKSHDEVARTLEQAARLNLPAMGDPRWIAFSKLPPRRPTFSMLGRNLLAGLAVVVHGWISKIAGHQVRRGPITYRHGDITHADYADESFDAITCLSVVEDGVNVESYFKEMWRILKPGGLLVNEKVIYWGEVKDCAFVVFTLQKPSRGTRRDSRRW
jgi:SAM-dependent methyltransferase